MYSNGEDLKWFNYTFMSYKDNSYGTDGYLRVSASTSTSNFQSFNTFKIQIAISNKFQKICTLGLSEILDLITAFDKLKESFKNGFSESEIERKVGKSLSLIFKFFVDQNSKELLVRLELFSNETDFTRIIMPFQFEFVALSKILRQYVDNVFSIGVQIISNSLNSTHLEQLPQLLKSLPSGIVSKIPVHEEPVSEEMEKGAAETAMTIDDLDKFMGPNVENVPVPEEVKKALEHEEQVTEINSEFVSKILKNDLSVLETILTNITLSPAPILLFAKELSSLGNDDFSPLPGITEIEKKSLLYMSKLYFSMSHISYMNNRVPLPHAIPIFKYKAKEFSEENLELAYDLLLIGLYIRIIRRRLESSDSDAMSNCALFHLQIRCFTDPFVFSFLDDIQAEKLQTICSQRFKYFDSCGFFEKYKKKLEENKCQPVTQSDISYVVTELTSKVIGRTPYIIDLHDSSFKANSFRLGTENNFSLEQIINEIVPLELAEKLGKDIKSEEVIAELRSKHNISDEILNFFKKDKTKSKVSKIEKISNIERVVRHFNDEIPENQKELFLTYIKELENKKFDFLTTSFPLNEFGNNIIKALYIWDPSDSDIKNNYKVFFRKVEDEEVMDKELILAKVTEAAFSKENKDAGDWGDLLTNGD